MGKERGKIISFINKKGGVGKSTLTSLLASYLFSKGKSVVVIDCDESQHTVKLWHKEDIDNGLDVYPVVNVLSRDVPNIIEDYLDEEFDYILIDFPADQGQKGVLDCFPLLDVIFIPFYPNLEEADASFNFVEKFEQFQDVRVGVGQKRTNISFCFYRTGRTSAGKDAIRAIEKSGINLLENKIQYYNKMQDRSSSVNRMEKEEYSYKIDRFLNECLEFVDNTNVKNYE